MNAQAVGAAPTAVRIRRIAVAGNPNSGKTTVFNRLTGLRQHVANYPGVTVEKREGTLIGSDVIVIDLPGTYSLSARSPDEEIARDMLLGRIPGMARPDAVLLVIDASNLERNLYLASQIIEFGTPVVVACNMMDVAESRGASVDIAALSRELGVPVIPTVAADGRGIPEIRKALLGEPAPPAAGRSWQHVPAFESAAGAVQNVMERSGVLPNHAIRAGSVLWLMDYLSEERPGIESAEKFLKKLKSDDAAALRKIAREVSAAVPDLSATIIERRYAWISDVSSRVVRSAGPGATKVTLTDRIDAIATHRVYGILLFAVVMLTLFLSIFSWAEPLMGLIEAAQRGLAEWIRGRIDPGPLQSLLADGVVSGVGSVIVFFPQICILFLFLSILEDTGYMARAAFLMDRIMSRVGLHGRSFIPLMSSYACAIPGIMATRTIENPRDRLTTILIAPLMSCSARLPVYLILISAVFGDRLWLKTGVMFGLYAFGTITALLMAVLLKKTLLKGPRPTFIMELPPYHMPQLRAIVRTMWDRSKLFLTGAGTTIFAVCIVIWALSYFPRVDAKSASAETQKQLAALPATATAERDNILAGEQLRSSWLGKMGHAIEPVIRPLGFDWRLGVGILSSFLAREVFVGTMGITFSLGETDESSLALRDKLATATWPNGARLLTPRTGLALVVFYVLACQCVSTLAVVRRETGSWKWPAFMFGYMTFLAYGGALAVNQIGAAMGCR